MRTPAQRTRSFLRCRIPTPLLRLLKRGVSPRRLAWSLAVALMVGINPCLGLTTVSMLLIAWLFKLNHVATQIGIHIVAPLQWVLFLPFIHAGIVLFRAHRLPLSGTDIRQLSHHHPLQLAHHLSDAQSSDRICRRPSATRHQVLAGLPIHLEALASSALLP